MSAHLSEWTLRRLHAGELPAPEATQARAHTAGCDRCRSVLREAEEAQARFEAEVPFERFAAGVERAMARAGEQGSAQTRTRRRWAGPLMALAATVLLVVVARPLLGTAPGPGVRTKGGVEAELRIGGSEGPQRVARAEVPERLAPGERVRLGYAPGTRRYVLAVSVDAAGEVTPLYPEAGESLPVEAGAGMHWLPDSLEFTGSGAERVVLVLSDTPVPVEAASAAARQAFEVSGRDVLKMQTLNVAGEQSHWVLLKP